METQPKGPKLVRMNPAHHREMNRFGFTQNFEAFLRAFKELNEEFMKFFKVEDVAMWNKAGTQAMLRHVRSVVSKADKAKAKKYIDEIMTKDIPVYCTNKISVTEANRKLMLRYIKTSLDIQVSLYGLFSKYDWILDSIKDSPAAGNTEEEKKAHVDQLLKDMFSPLYIDIPLKLSSINETIDIVINRLYNREGEYKSGVEVIELNKINDVLEEKEEAEEEVRVPTDVLLSSMSMM